MPFREQYRLKILKDGFEYESQFGNGKVTYLIDEDFMEYSVISIGTKSDVTQTGDIEIPSMLQLGVSMFESIVKMIMENDLYSELLENPNATPYIQ
jgi:hypothetical protein